ncbi:MAG: family NAD(P)-dependent oxidoreductase [Homoserinimonas sp.]|nr:family NAD(P)-dependent oxidoreductase [Homoserinimonas sp.]
MTERHRADAVDALVEGRSLDGTHAWVTGGGSGLGRASAIAVARLGATVHLMSRTERQLNDTAEAIAALGGSAVVTVCDVTDMEQVSAVFAGSTVDVLVNCAGANIAQNLDEITSESYRTVMDLNVQATLFVTQSAVRRMRAAGRGGSIVNMTSQMGHVGGPRRIVYCASKWAVEGMTKALALELGPDRIRVNSVSPTFVETEMTASALADPTFRSWALGEIPLGRFGGLDEVAAAVAYLASPMSSMTTGASLSVDGGWTAH